MDQLRRIISIVLGVLSLYAGTGVHAQNPVETYLLYYEDETPGELDTTLLRNNICLEAVLRLNPGLDPNNISYGDRFWIPVDEPCYRYDGSKISYGYFTDGYPLRLKYYEDGQWLDEPYYTDEVVYIRADSIVDIARQYNICLNDLLADNILLHEFDAYRTYANISIDVFIPEDAPPCDPDPNWTPPLVPFSSVPNASVITLARNEVNPLTLVNQYNVCPEEIDNFILDWYLFYDLSYANHNYDLTIPGDALPCYNEAGQRLIYYDSLGQPLEQPVYSDFPVYIAQPGETLPGIAARTGTCLVDLLRINNFPDMPLIVPVEIFVPPPQPCPEGITPVQLDTQLEDVHRIALEKNICPEEFLRLNPHFMSQSSWGLPSVHNRLYSTRWVGTWILLPTDIVPCYDTLIPEELTLAEIERKINICYQEFIFEPGQPFSFSITGHITLYIRRDAPPCYDDQGRRLQYPSLYPGLYQADVRPQELHYVDTPIHIFQTDDTVYKISRQYNVCVRDLLDANPVLVSQMPTGYPTIIPQTRPCYDESTGLPLIYEAEDGQPLPEPVIGDELIYYGSQPLGYISYYYNVCANRIEDANHEKLERKRHYPGWIIPTDRPPCYDDDGNSIDYVCYDQPVDFTVDYRRMDPPLSFNVDGTYCYDLARAETLIWSEGKPYIIINYFGNMLFSRAFTAWCFGVSLEEIDRINENSGVLSMLSLHTRAIPLPTRTCYVVTPEILNNQTIHTVAPGETLYDIAQQYDKFYGWIARANDLDAQFTIWAGQQLIIPAGMSLTNLYWLAGGVLAGSSLLAGYVITRRQRPSTVESQSPAS